MKMKISYFVCMSSTPNLIKPKETLNHLSRSEAIMKMKIQAYSSFVGSISLYNAELWTLKIQKDQHLPKMNYPKKITNKEP